MNDEIPQEETIQDKMYRELHSGEIFQQALSYGLKYLRGLDDRAVFPKETAVQNTIQFEEEFPLNSMNASEVISLLHNVGAPATVATLGGRYFGFVTGSVVPVGLAAKTLATYWDQVSAMYVISPLASKLETVVERWLIKLFGIPNDSCAGFVSGTSSANLCGLAAARYEILKRLNWDVNQKGLFGAPKIRIVTGEHAHSTVIKAISLLGFGKAAIEFAKVDNQGRIIPDELPHLDSRTILILQAGNVNSGSFDDFGTIIPQAKDAGTWVHVDGAFGLWTAACNKLSHLTDGIQMADSWAVDGHKTLNTPYDCGILMCRDRHALTNALHMSAGYIIESQERDGMLFTPEMSRRARIIELWAILKYLGQNGLNDMIYLLYQRARQFADEINDVEGYTIENDIFFNQVIISCENDELTDQVLQRVQESGECWAGGSTWFGKRVIRISICAWTTIKHDISRSVLAFRKALAECV